MKKKVILVTSLLFILLIFFVKIIGFAEKPLEISKMCTIKQSDIYIDDYLYYDYIEIYNPNKKSVYIGEYGISNNKDNLFKYTIMNGLWLGAKDSIIIYFSSEYTGENWTVAKFDINEKDEYIYLTDSKGKIVSKIENVK